VPELHVLRVFANEDAEFGNPLAVFLEGASVPLPARQRVAQEIGFSETVFVEDRAGGRLSIHTPGVELPFAGHPLVGTAWLLAEVGWPATALHPAAGEVAVRVEGDTAHIAGRAEWSPPFEYLQMDSPAEVRVLNRPPSDTANVYAWAWIDEAAGTVRARAFVPAAGIAEDEATGSAALALCARLDRPLTIHQGRGSVLLAHPLSPGIAEVGGRVRLDEVREHPV
jgi:predicted PhzF superfamily epimerase YddE/YHI9